MTSLLDAERDPDFINAEGVKWWIQKETNRYIKSKGNLGKIQAWKTEFPDTKQKRYVLTENDSVIYETAGLEALGVRIDLLSFLRECDEKDT